MRFPRLTAVALLSAGLLGHLSVPTEGDRRHVSSCGDATVPSTTLSPLPLPTALFSSVQDDAVRQASQAYFVFLRQLQLNATLNSLQAPSLYGFPVPTFPSYALPNINNYQIDLTKPAASTLMWNSFTTDPALQYLVQPLKADPRPAAVPGSLQLTPAPVATAVTTPQTQVSGTFDPSRGGTVQVSKF